MKLIVKKSGKTWGVFALEMGKPDELVVGGFFEWSAAIEAKDELENDLLRNEVEQAERKAGWDPNP